MQDQLNRALVGRYRLERAFQVRSAGLIYLQVDTAYQALRADPRFRSLVDRIGLP